MGDEKILHIAQRLFALTNRTSVRYTVYMLVQALPDTITKLSQIGDVTHFEPAGDQPQSERRRVPYQARSLADCITNVSTPGGKKPLLKTMVTTSPLRSKRSFWRSGRSAPASTGRASSRRRTPAGLF